MGTVAEVKNELGLREKPIPVTPVPPVQLLLEDESPVTPVEEETVLVPGRQMAT